MNLYIRLVTDPHPETWLRLLTVLVIIIVVTVPVILSGYSPQNLITFLLGISVAGTQAGRPLPAALLQGGGR